MSGSEGYAWALHEDRELWLDQIGDRLPDVGYPPRMYAWVRADGCVELTRLFNGAMPHSPGDNSGADSDEMHICDLDEFIADLQALRDKRRAVGLEPEPIEPYEGRMVLDSNPDSNSTERDRTEPDASA